MMKKLFLTLCVGLLFLTGCTSGTQTVTTSEPQYRLFKNGYWLHYPDYFSDIDVMKDGKFVRFTSASQKVYMQVTVTSKQQAKQDRSQFLERGWHTGESKTLASGAQADLLFTDLRKIPEEGTANCSFAYQYIVPSGTDDTVSVWYQVKDDNWRGEASSTCTAYKDPEYSFHLKQIESIISQFQP